MIAATIRSGQAVAVAPDADGGEHDDDIADGIVARA